MEKFLNQKLTSSKYSVNNNRSIKKINDNFNITEINIKDRRYKIYYYYYSK